MPVVFDAAHALGALADGRPVGGFGDAEVFSLTPTKVLVAGEGGLVATRDAGLAERLRIGRDYGNPGDYDTRFAGLNARMSEFHAAMALESLEMFDDTLARRRATRRALLGPARRRPGRPLAGDRCPSDLSTYKDFTIVGRARVRCSPATMLVAVARRGRHRHAQLLRPSRAPPTGIRTTCEAGELPITEALAANVISLPIYTDLEDDDIMRVVDAIAVTRDHTDALSRMGEVPEMRRHRTSPLPR